jgi:hypothetical protein
MSKPAAAAPAPPSTTFALDTADVERRVWLVKVPDCVAEVVAPAAATNADVASFIVVGQTAGGGGGSSRKRPRISLKVELNPARVVEVLGEGALGRTPTKFDLFLEEPIGARIFTRGRGGAAAPSAGAGSRAGGGVGFTLLGTAAFSGTMRPDVNDHAYAAYASARRVSDKAAADSSRRTSSLARPEDVAGSQRRAREEAAALLAAGGPVGRDRASIVAVPRARSVLEAFEKAPVWSLRQLAESTGASEGSLRADAAKYADYVRAGPWAGSYVLKAEFRSASSAPMPDPVEATSRGARAWESKF